MGVNWSALGLRGGGGGARALEREQQLRANEVAAEDEQALFHPRKRRPSDVSMQTVLHEPLVSDAFRDFMHEKLSENLVSLWIDLYAYERISYESERKVRRAREIYAKYFANHAPLGSVCRDFLDAETLAGLRACLDVDPESDFVRQRDPRALGASFKLTYAKLVTFLKFEFMPQFLVSKHFGRLGASKDESFWAEMEASEAPTAETVLQHPWLLSYFSEFITSIPMRSELMRPSQPKSAKATNEARGLGAASTADSLSTSNRIIPRKGSTKDKAKKDEIPSQSGRNESQTDDDLIDVAGDEDDAEYAQHEFMGTLRSARDLVELYFEIEDYSCWVADNAHQFERLRRILSRFGNTDACRGQERPAIQPPIVFLEQHLTLFEMKISRYHDLVYRQQDAAFFNGVRQEVLRRLNAHLIPLFRDNFLAALNFPATGRERRAERSDARIRQLVHFAEQRNLANQFTYTYTLESALSLPWGAYYLKRFARKRLQEESVLFVLETDAYRLLEAHTKEERSAQDTAQIRRRIKRICDLYVSDAAPLQVNISHAQRSAILHQALADQSYTQDIFEEARDEVLRMLRLNLWPAFQQDNMHENFLRKCAHNMHRRSSEGGPVLQTSSHMSFGLYDIPSTPSTISPSSSPTSAATSSHRSCALHAEHQIADDEQNRADKVNDDEVDLEAETEAHILDKTKATKSSCPTNESGANAKASSTDNMVSSSLDETGSDAKTLTTESEENAVTSLLKSEYALEASKISTDVDNVTQEEARQVQSELRAEPLSDDSKRVSATGAAASSSLGEPLAVEEAMTSVARGA
ncbi:Regulator of G-protein signaling 13 [Hondaea fermentalgiana]|uniref:Regulator of G-protein signaling 13 n=1 Tax=Hondaea fermentalgiana TaxID=2315210 RepID=A0A2R5G8P5_9STRA|nr:Regulator of G-protein signaling 13 [Hondaea fermentalgiana]|eukprot:GBG24853.1 Regulator of G-protein signaling 13 [Hondaea fermentalgiana]